MKTNEDFLSPEEQLRFENEILKLKLEHELGAKAIHTPEDMPPEMENAWLTQIYEYEKEQSNPAFNKTVLEHLGNPPFKLLEELQPTELLEEFGRLLDLLEVHGFKIRSASQHSLEVMYSFITKELLPLKVYHNYQNGEALVFTYEDFHPDIEHYIRRVTEDFIQAFFDNSEYPDLARIFLNDSIFTKNDKLISAEECLTLIREVQKVYPNKELHYLGTEEVYFDDKKGYAKARIRYSSDAKDIHEVKVRLDFTPDELFYVIHKISIPGILEI